MAQKKDSGIFQTESGQWGYRFTLVIEGKRISRRKFTDSDGNRLASRKEEVKAREDAIIIIQGFLYLKSSPLFQEADNRPCGKGQQKLFGGVGAG